MCQFDSARESTDSQRPNYTPSVRPASSCRRRGIHPWKYVRDALRRLPGMTQSELPSGNCGTAALLEIDRQAHKLNRPFGTCCAIEPLHPTGGLR